MAGMCGKAYMSENNSTAPFMTYYDLFTFYYFLALDVVLRFVHLSFFGTVSQMIEELP